MNNLNKGLSLLSLQSSGKASYQHVIVSVIIWFHTWYRKEGAGAVKEVIKEPGLICKGRSLSEGVMVSAESSEMSKRSQMRRGWSRALQADGTASVKTLRVKKAGESWCDWNIALSHFILVLVQAAVTKCHRLGALINNRSLFFSSGRWEVQD